MYTTWQNNYSDLETFEQLLATYPAPNLWLTPRLFASFIGGQPQLVIEGERGRNYTLEQSADLSSWGSWTNVTAGDATLTFWPGAITDKSRFYRASCSQ